MESKLVVEATMNSILVGAVSGLLVCSLSAFADDGPAKMDAKAAEANLRKAREALKQTESGLKLLDKALYAGYVVTGKPDLKAAREFADQFQKPLGEMKKHTDTVVELAERKKDKAGAEKEGKSLLEKVKLVKIKNQAEELDRLAKNVRDLPVGLVSEESDAKFVVSPELLLKDPKQAESRFKAYLSAMVKNAEYLRAKQDELDETAKIAKRTGKFLAEIQTLVEKATPFCGIYVKPLTEFYLDLDKLASAFNGLASDCAKKSGEARRAADAEKRRHDNLKENLWKIFGIRT